MTDSFIFVVNLDLKSCLMKRFRNDDYTVSSDMLTR